MKIVKTIQSKQFNHKMTKLLRMEFKKYKKDKSIPIYKLREYAQLVLSANPLDAYKTQIKSIEGSYWIELASTEKMKIGMFIVAFSRERWGTTDDARINFSGTLSTRAVGTNFIVQSNCETELEYYGNIDVDSMRNTPLTGNVVLTEAAIDIICDTVLRTLKQLEW